MQSGYTSDAAGSLASLAEINDLALELMAGRAGGDAAGLPPLLRDSAGLWRALGAVQRRRLAGCPFLLIEIGFDEFLPLSRGAPGGVRESREEVQWFAEESLPRLSYLTLTYAWHLVQTRRFAARIVLGLRDDSVEWLAALSLRQLGECLECSPHFLRPRWARSPEVWRYLLTAAASAEPADFELARLRGMQLLAAACWPAPRSP